MLRHVSLRGGGETSGLINRTEGIYCRQAGKEGGGLFRHIAVVYKREEEGRHGKKEEEEKWK